MNLRNILPRKGLLILVLLWLLPWCALSLQWPVSEEILNQTSAQIRALVTAAEGVRVDGLQLPMSAQLRRFYQEREFKPVWIEREGIHLEVAELLRVVDQAENEGLPKKDYHLGTIENHLATVSDEPARLARLDLLLTDTFLHYSRHVRSGRVGPRRADDDWFLPYAPFDASTLLPRLLTDSSLGEALEGLPPPHTGYRRLRNVLQRYRTLASQGGWPQVTPGETLQMGSEGPRVMELRARLRVSGDLREQNTLSPELFDVGLHEGVRRFQHRHGLETDGRVGRNTLAALNVPVDTRIRQIEINMERWRWLPHDMPMRYIQVNMAGYELDLYEADIPVMHMRVIVGREYRQTPVFKSEITDVVLNPYWYVPRIIFREDILPTLRRNPARLARLKMRLLQNGSEVDASEIDWSRVNAYRFPYTLRQEPGPHNALGRIKFLLPNDFGIYLHDTPDRHLFERTTRALSSGCIRLEQPLDLARYLLAGSGEWDRARLEAAIEEGGTRTLSVPEPLPVYFTYWTAWVDQDGVVQFRDDIYQRDHDLLKLWGKSAT